MTAKKDAKYRIVAMGSDYVVMEGDRECSRWTEQRQAESELMRLEMEEKYEPPIERKDTGVHRLDVGGLTKPKRTSAGFLRADAYLTRAGIFRYRNADGSTRREFRPPTEVFSKESMDSFALAPVTDDHPPANLTADNAREYQRGAVTENVKQDGDHLSAGMLITDAELIRKMERGEKTQVSCGYTCDVDFAPGEWRGEKYDAVQRNIRGNHVAIVPVGRAGASARVRMDGANAAMLQDHVVEPTERTRAMKTFKLDGITFEANEQVIEAVEKLQRAREELKAKLDAADSETAKKVDALQAKLDQAASELEKAKADAAKAPEQIREQIKTRMDLEAKAKKALGKEAKLDGKSDRDVRVEVLKKLEPKLDVAKKSDEYVAARFDAACDSMRDSASEISQVRAVAERKDSEDEEREDVEHDRYDSEAARKRMVEANRELWKQPIGRNGKAA